MRAIPGENCVPITELHVPRDAFAQGKIATRPAPGLAPGEVLLRIEKFALTANNITYALAGDSIGYWKFFPCPDPYGIVPVWGFASVKQSACADLPIGTRIWGFLPLASHVVMQPKQIGPRGFIDGAAHRQALPEVYNRYAFTMGDAPELAAIEDARCLLFPLFITSYVLSDYLEDNGYFGADQVLIGSASSKTAFGLADILHRHAKPKMRVIGLTSQGNIGFVEGLGIYDEVLAYPEMARLDPGIATAFVDMSGDGPLIGALHRHFRENIRANIAVGITHWAASRAERPPEGAPPRFFFAPAQIIKREADWGPGVIMRRAQAECLTMAQRAQANLTIQHVHGPHAVEAAYRAMAEGKTPPDIGLMLSMHEHSGTGSAT